MAFAIGCWSSVSPGVVGSGVRSCACSEETARHTEPPTASVQTRSDWHGEDMFFKALPFKSELMNDPPARQTDVARSSDRRTPKAGTRVASEIRRRRHVFTM